MGTLEYGTGQDPCEIDDRVLLHLQVVITTKLRRGERFVFRCGSDGHACGNTFWMDPTIPLRFHSEPDRTGVNPAWLHLLAETAATSTGLRVIPEPAPAGVHLRAATNRTVTAAASR